MRLGGDPADGRSAARPINRRAQDWRGRGLGTHGAPVSRPLTLWGSKTDRSCNSLFRAMFRGREFEIFDEPEPAVRAPSGDASDQRRPHALSNEPCGPARRRRYPSLAGRWARGGAAIATLAAAAAAAALLLPLRGDRASGAPVAGQREQPPLAQPPARLRKAPPTGVSSLPDRRGPTGSGPERRRPPSRRNPADRTRPAAPGPPLPPIAPSPPAPPPPPAAPPPNPPSAPQRPPGTTRTPAGQLPAPAAPRSPFEP
jgi:hypothetical protein